MIPLAIPNLAGDEARYLAECVSTGFVSSIGPFPDRLEAVVAASAGARRRWQLPPARPAFTRFELEAYPMANAFAGAPERRLLDGEVAGGALAGAESNDTG